MHALPSFSYSILNQWPACQVTKGEKKRDGGDDSSYLSPGMTGVTSTHRSLSRICHITPFPAGETGKRKRAHDTFGEHQQSTTPHHRGRCQRLQLYLLVVCKLLFKNRILSSIQYINKANVELFWLKWRRREEDPYICPLNTPSCTISVPYTFLQDSSRQSEDLSWVIGSPGRALSRRVVWSHFPFVKVNAAQLWRGVGGWLRWRVCSVGVKVRGRGGFRGCWSLQTTEGEGLNHVSMGLCMFTGFLPAQNSESFSQIKTNVIWNHLHVES